MGVGCYVMMRGIVVYVFLPHFACPLSFVLAAAVKADLSFMQSPTIPLYVYVRPVRLSFFVRSFMIVNTRLCCCGPTPPPSIRVVTVVRLRMSPLSLPCSSLLVHVNKKNVAFTNAPTFQSVELEIQDSLHRYL